MHSIHVDRARGLVELRILAMLSPEDAGWIGEELREAILSLGEPLGRHVTLYDVSAVTVIPKATIDAVLRTFDHPAVRALWARRVAFVVSSALGRMQAQRVRQIRDDIRVFDDRREALAWLLAE